MLNKKLFLVFFLLLFVLPQISLASCPTGTQDGDGTQLCNPLGDKIKDIPDLAGQIINAVLGVVGSLALVMIIYGGFTWMTAAGNQEAVKKGRDILIWAFIGIVIIFSAYALVKFAFKTIGVV